MKYIVLQETGDKWPVLATCAGADAALLLAEALLRVPAAEPKCVQVWAQRNGRQEYSIFCGRGWGSYQAIQLEDARMDWKKIAKKWRAQQKQSRVETQARISFLARFDGPGKYSDQIARRATLNDDPDFRQALYGTPPRFDDAERRAVELGIIPREAAQA